MGNTKTWALWQAWLRLERHVFFSWFLRGLLMFFSRYVFFFMVLAGGFVVAWFVILILVWLFYRLWLVLIVSMIFWVGGSWLFGVNHWGCFFSIWRPPNYPPPQGSFLSSVLLLPRRSVSKMPLGLRFDLSNVSSSQSCWEFPLDLRDRTIWQCFTHTNGWKWSDFHKTCGRFGLDDDLQTSLALAELFDTDFFCFERIFY